MTALLRRWRGRIDRRHPAEDRLLKAVLGTGGTDAGDLPQVVHHGEVVEAVGLEPLRAVAHLGPDGLRPAVGGEEGVVVEAEFHGARQYTLRRKRTGLKPVPTG